VVVCVAIMYVIVKVYVLSESKIYFMINKDITKFCETEVIIMS